MNKTEENPYNLKRAKVFAMKAALVIIMSLLFMVVLVRFTPTLYYQKGNYLGIVFYAFLFSMICVPYDGFKIGILRLREIFFSFIIVVLLTNSISYIVLALISRSLISPLPMLILTLVQIIVGRLCYKLFNSWYFKLYPSRDCIIVYSNSRWDKDVARKFEARRERYTVKKIFKEGDDLDEIIAAINQYSTCIVGQVNPTLRHVLLNYCYKHNKRLFIMPNVDDILIQNSHVTQVGDSLVYLVNQRAQTLEQLIVKRLFDIFFSFLFLLLSLPLTLTVAIIIKATDGGPVFFKQKRYTRFNKTFDIIKFRSMVVDAEKDGAQYTVDDDKRITPIGRFIRKTRIDEIPQFINVLKGEMSIVGPRAERTENHEAYLKLMPAWEYRTRVKAGITGYAQIYGKYNTSFEDKARMDIYYIENYSFLNDLKLIFATVKVLFKPDATEGFSTQFFDEDEK